MLVARVRHRRAATLAELRRELGRLAPGEPVVAAWWSDSIDALVPLRTPRFQTLVLATFAVLALALTALGIFAVVSFVVAMRTREMGVRLALGAAPRSLVGLVVRQAMLPVAAGAVAGAVVSRWVNALVQSQLFGVQPGDPVVVAAAIVAVVATALVAACVPAREASRVNPVDVLRAP